MRISAVTALIALIGASAPALAQKVYTQEDAAQVLGACPGGVQPLENGQCPPVIEDERGFSLADPAAGPTGQQASRPKSSAGQATRAKPPRMMVARAPRGQELPITFLRGSSELSDQSKRNIETLAAAMLAPENQGKRIRIEGHTDRTGSAELNQRLSEQRAQSVATYMASLGVPRERLDAKGIGYNRLLPGLPPAHPSHRRVEVIRVQ